MQFRFSFLLACLLTTTFLSANNGSLHSPILHSSCTNIFSCELPPPTNFHVIERGPTSVTFEWIPFMDAVQNRIRTYRASDNFLLNETILPAGITTAKIQNLPVNTNLYSTINSVCVNGDHGEDSPLLRFPALILDLIVSGYTPGEQRNCTIQNASNRCSFAAPGPMTTFKIYNATHSRQFGVQYFFDEGGEHLQVCLGSSGNGDPNFKFYCNYLTNPDCFGAEKIHVTYHSGGIEIPVADFELIKDQTIALGYFQCIWLSSLFKFDRLVSPLGFDRPSTDSRNANGTTSNQPASISPNPFSEKLDVYPANPSAENIHLQLFNLNGQKVLDQEFEGGQEQYSLSTASLAPGFYLLRIEADGEVQTLKVVKSE